MTRKQILEREKKALQMRERGLTFKEIGDDLKVSRARAHQIVKRAYLRISQRS